MQRTIIKITLFVFFVIFYIVPTNNALAAVLARPPSNLGLVGYWNFDEGAGTVAGDSSGSGNNGTITGATWTDGKRGRALNLNGVNDYLNLSLKGLNDPNLYGGVNGKSTFSIWIKPTRGSGINYDTFARHFGGFHYFSIIDDNRKLRLMVGDVVNNVNFWPQSNGSVNLNEWNHIVFQLEGGVGYKIYINGVLDNNVSNPNLGIINYSNTTALGATLGGTANYFKGEIDDVRIYNRALSAGEIARLYSGGQVTRKTVSNQGLVGYWSFDEGAGTVAGDSSGSGNHGSITGATWTDGKRGKALSFDGISSYVDVNLINSGLTGSQTISAWMKSSGPPSGKPHQTILATDNTYLYGVKLMTYKNINRVGLWVGNGSSSYEAFVNVNINDGKWHFVSGVYDYNAGTVTIFIDGVAYSPINSGQITVNISNLGKIGRDYHNSDYSYNGLIDDVRIYNRALSAGEIQKLYQQSSATINSSQNNKMTDGLVGLWSFDGKDISGTTAYDRSGQGNNGTITGAKPTIGKIGQGMSFSGSSYVSTTNNINYSSNAFTVSAWVHPTDITNCRQTIVSSKENSSAGFVLAQPEGSCNKFRIWVNIGSWKSLDTLSTISLNTWYYLTATYDGSDLKIFLNGIQNNSISLPGTVNNPSDVTTIGSRNSNNTHYSKAILDDVRIYNRALSAEEVKQLYLMGK